MDCMTVRELHKNTEAYIGKEVTVGGWVRSNRDSKSFGFIVLSDGTFFTPVQVVYNRWRISRRSQRLASAAL